ncbi:MAG: hypothetical protein HY075_07315, partial [Deltaproteobacteria bacterium]|nr:hypothetical protein [Deltaproteobacteria bacterium]
PPWAWLALVVGVDVAHVYSTMFRTYLDPRARARHAGALVLVPLLGWGAGAVVHALSARAFWSALAYLAVFHFVRQQYGFLALYSRRERGASKLARAVDRAAIYLATLYPLVYWHTHLPRNFSWFVAGDFLVVRAPWLERVVFALYVVALAAYFGKSLRRWASARELNVPRDLLVAGTALSWYVGIVWLNGDAAFTATNVVSHGVPYLALVWAYARRHSNAAAAPRLAAMLRVRALPVFFGALVALAFVEEGFWDGFVWRDHPGIFRVFEALPRVTDAATLAWLVPLLALPQITHYLLDGFIWKVRGRESEWA